MSGLKEEKNFEQSCIVRVPDPADYLSYCLFFFILSRLHVILLSTHFSSVCLGGNLAA